MQRAEELKSILQKNIQRTESHDKSALNSTDNGFAPLGIKSLTLRAFI